MRFATWNLDNRVGKVRFRTEAADAALALDADVVVLTEYFPRDQHEAFRRTLSVGGLVHQVLTREPPERANRVLIASRVPLVSDPLPLPDFDHQFPANLLAAGVQSLGLRVLGVRVPAYEPEQRVLLATSWAWLEEATAALAGVPAAIIGDLNVGIASPPSSGGGHLRRRLQAGWTRAAPQGGHTYDGHRGAHSHLGAAPARRTKRPPRAASCLQTSQGALRPRCAEIRCGPRLMQTAIRSCPDAGTE